MGSCCKYNHSNSLTFLRMNGEHKEINSFDISLNLFCLSALRKNMECIMTGVLWKTSFC